MGGRKLNTSVRKKTLNPEFNEEFLYAGRREELARKTLLCPCGTMTWARPTTSSAACSWAAGPAGSAWAAVTAGWGCGTHWTAVRPPAQRRAGHLARPCALLRPKMTHTPPRGGRKGGCRTGLPRPPCPSPRQTVPSSSPSTRAQCQTRNKPLLHSRLNQASLSCHHRTEQTGLCSPSPPIKGPGVDPRPSSPSSHPSLLPGGLVSRADSLTHGRPVWIHCPSRPSWETGP